MELNPSLSSRAALGGNPEGGRKVTRPRSHDNKQQHGDHSQGLGRLVQVLCPVPVPDPAGGLWERRGPGSVGQPRLLVACQPWCRSRAGALPAALLGWAQEALIPGLQPRGKGKGLSMLLIVPMTVQGQSGASHCLLPPASAQLFWPRSPISPACLWEHWAFVCFQNCGCVPMALSGPPPWFQAQWGGPTEPQALLQIPKPISQ